MVMNLLKEQLSEYHKAVIKVVQCLCTRNHHVLPPSRYITVKEDVVFRYSGNIDNVSLLFSTSKGVFVFDSEQEVSRKILDGKYYGITKYRDLWFLARTNITDSRIEKIDRLSTISAAKINEFKVAWLKPVLVPKQVRNL